MSSGGDVAGGGFPGEERPVVGGGGIAVEMDQLGWVILAEGHFTAIERLHPATDRFQDRFFPRPGAEESVQMIIGTVLLEQFAFARTEETGHQTGGIGDGAEPFHVDADPGPPKGKNGQPIRMGDIEVCLLYTSPSPRDS